ncbi:MBL fold metallo-hydrolase [Sphingobacterium sp. lm-10]|uniref:MBL fold metallo-hydrolase n=1 Tax=Sphingobacterium sp. lm-10 TaxID=2944904 RepID=UPI002021677D|nr:MBL fold metallo-hydrolase [Sphingobacterium sp. lm-10]MCL7986462.1 MBL fold metallo-hydrolase [Sphingobacterium sp. lm-10]
MKSKTILSDFLVKKGDAYYCRYGDFYIDPLYPVKTAIVSHAHGDHASPGHLDTYATPFTVAFMQQRFPKYTKEAYTAVPFNTSWTINGIKITLLAAGHILGSAQILMEYQGVRYLYTGDYKLQDDPTCEPIQFVQADVLITETTFADPTVQHPDPAQEIQQLNEINSNILLGCYTLGKAQRITHLLNTYCPDKVVLLHHRMLMAHRLYDQYSPASLNYKVYGRKDMKEGIANKVYLVPPLTFNSYFRATNVARVFASGWAKLQQHNDLSLYISDHVDWADLLHYINGVNPLEIWTIHGDGSKLKSHLANQISVRDIQSTALIPVGL